MPMWVKNSYFVTKLRVFSLTDNEFWTQDLRSQSITNAILKLLNQIFILI
jgi:hypothetical protein